MLTFDDYLATTRERLHKATTDDRWPNESRGYPWSWLNLDLYWLTRSRDERRQWIRSEQSLLIRAQQEDSLGCVVESFTGGRINCPDYLGNLSETMLLLPPNHGQITMAVKDGYWSVSIDYSVCVDTGHGNLASTAMAICALVARRSQGLLEEFEVE